MPKAGRLLDLKALARCIEQTGNQSALRGVEATVNGVLIQEKARWLVRASKTGETFVLAPLREKVQWDVKAKRRVPPTDKERSAFKSLAAKWRDKPVSVQVIGPVTKPEEGKPPTLEVREFTWEFREQAAPP